MLYEFFKMWADISYDSENFNVRFSSSIYSINLYQKYGI